MPGGHLDYLLLVTNVSTNPAPSSLSRTSQHSAGAGRLPVRDPTPTMNGSRRYKHRSSLLTADYSTSRPLLTRAIHRCGDPGRNIASGFHHRHDAHEHRGCNVEPLRDGQRQRLDRIIGGPPRLQLNGTAWLDAQLQQIPTSASRCCRLTVGHSSWECRAVVLKDVNGVYRSARAADRRGRQTGTGCFHRARCGSNTASSQSLTRLLPISTAITHHRALGHNLQNLNLPIAPKRV